jgi:hypothetical protein
MPLFFLLFLLVFSCTPPAAEPVSAANVPTGPVVPAAPESPPGRVLQFDMLTGSVTADGHGSELLLDNKLETSWISRVLPETPASIELILPKKEGEQKVSGSCVSQVGVIPGVFVNKALAEQVSLPTEFRIEYTQVASQAAPKKGKSAKPKGPTALGTNVQEVSAILPGTESTEIQWLSVPEICSVLRMRIRIVGSLPRDRAAVAISELYVITKP